MRVPHQLNTLYATTGSNNLDTKRIGGRSRRERNRTNAKISNSDCSPSTSTRPQTQHPTPRIEPSKLCIISEPTCVGLKPTNLPLLCCHGGAHCCRKQWLDQTQLSTTPPADNSGAFRRGRNGGHPSGVGCKIHDCKPNIQTGITSARTESMRTCINQKSTLY